MGIASVSPQGPRMAALSVFVSPVQSFLSLFTHPESAGQKSRSSSPQSAPRNGTTGRRYALKSAGSQRRAHACATIPVGGIKSTPSKLKVVRQFEPDVGAAFAGRMMISGRMADVCAELDRMEKSQSGSAQMPIF